MASFSNVPFKHIEAEQLRREVEAWAKKRGNKIQKLAWGEKTPLKPIPDLQLKTRAMRRGKKPHDRVFGEQPKDKGKK